MIQSQTTAYLDIKNMQRITAAYTRDVEIVVWGAVREISQAPRDPTLLRAIFGLNWWSR